MAKKTPKFLDKVVKAIKDAADEYSMSPQDVKIAHIQTDEITEWELRKLGGLSTVKKMYFPFEEKDLAAIYKLTKGNAYVTKLEKQVGEIKHFETAIIQSITDAIKQARPKPIKIKKAKRSKLPNMTMELMISDVHYGKKTEKFNLDICRARMRELVRVFIKEKQNEEKHFNIDRIIVALIGDIIESFTMHGMESAMGCEFVNTVQIQSAIESLFYDVIIPIAQLGIPVDIPAVTGNHDRSEFSRTMHNPGETNLTWIIYNSLQLLCKEAKLKNVKFYIPIGPYVLLDIYGSPILYEHLDNVKSTAKEPIEKLMQKRSKQVGKVIEFIRGGHWHEYLCYGRGRVIINESVCGLDSYADVMGFNSHAGQTINYYVETEKRPNCFYKSFPVYLG